MKVTNEKVLSDLINQKVFEFAGGSLVKLYLVGGYIRDLLVGIEKDDRDYVLEGYGAWDFAKRVAGVLKGTFVGLDKERDMARVVIENRTLDFSGTSGKLIEEDIKRRDFTVNSIAWSPEGGIFDPLNGIDDIKRRVIRAIKKENMQEDPLRLLRAYRIGAELKMDIEPETEKIITESSHLLTNASGERITSELFLLIRSPHSFIYILKAAKTGILESIFPELSRTRGIPPQGNHHLSTFDHSLEVFRQVEILLKEIPSWVLSNLQEEVSSGISQSTILKLCGLLHDIGKPVTVKTTHEGKYTFIDHERAGSELIETISERLKFSNNITEALKSVVKGHSIPLKFIKDEHLDMSYLYRFFIESDEYLIILILMSIADIRSMDLEKDNLRTKEIRLLEVLEKYKIFKIKDAETPRLLTGEDIMKVLNMRPGPEVGRVKEILRLAQMLEEVRDKEDAIEYIKNLFDLT